MARFFRPTIRAAAFTSAGAGVAYQGYRHFNATSGFFGDAYAESIPSDARAALKKMEWKGFTELKLESAEMYNHNVKRLTFALPNDQSITGISPINQPGTITFMVKRYPDGKGSGKMHSLVPGDTMKFKPLHEFDYKPNQFSQMTFIAGGSGITPIYQLTQAILHNPTDKTKISLIYANNSPEDILLREEFDELERKFPDRFQKFYTVSKNESGADLHQGYVTKELVQKVTPTKSDKVLVSGPPAMTEAIAGAKGGFGWTQGSLGGILKELGYDKEQVHKF